VISAGVLFAVYIADVAGVGVDVSRPIDWSCDFGMSVEKRILIRPGGGQGGEADHAYDYMYTCLFVHVFGC